eukprot:TRINITY_DN12986_c0_g1_i2.p1 TRINITY_DN12986_c0_g1~~TRINITY_DN12986_c0_g1_i2.p1  ORF type:complete len:338 (-),score=26.57 TRINITY_DN12986_c0_g1_i2:34-1047(-)
MGNCTACNQSKKRLVTNEFLNRKERLKLGNGYPSSMTFHFRISLGAFKCTNIPVSNSYIIVQIESVREIHLPVVKGTTCPQWLIQEEFDASIAAEDFNYKSITLHLFEAGVVEPIGIVRIPFLEAASGPIAQDIVWAPIGGRKSIRESRVEFELRMNEKVKLELQVQKSFFWVSNPVKYAEVNFLVQLATHDAISSSSHSESLKVQVLPISFKNETRQNLGEVGSPKIRIFAHTQAPDNDNLAQNNQLSSIQHDSLEENMKKEMTEFSWDFQSKDDALSIVFETYFDQLMSGSMRVTLWGRRQGSISYPLLTGEDDEDDLLEAVSYTHLTLPTIYSV